MLSIPHFCQSLTTPISNPDAVAKIVTALAVKVSPRDLKSKDQRPLLTLIMQQWLPLSTATFQAIVDIIPPPDIAQSQRLPFMIHPEQAASSPTPLQPVNHLEEGLYRCDRSENAEVVGYVSKMFAVARGDLPEFRKRDMTAEEMRQRGKEERERRAALAVAASTTGPEPSAMMPAIEDGTQQDPTAEISKSLEELQVDSEASNGIGEDMAESSEVLLAFSRIFSGRIRRGATMLALLPKFDPQLPSTHKYNAKFVKRVQVKDLYMMMGRELVTVEEVSAGQVCAIGGLEGNVHRNATLWAPRTEGLKEGQEAGKLVNLAGVAMQVS